jgi:hypothetical protein
VELMEGYFFLGLLIAMVLLIAFADFDDEND